MSQNQSPEVKHSHSMHDVCGGLVALNRRQLLVGAGASLLTAGVAGNNFYSAEQYFREVEDLFPDAGAVYRGDRLVSFVGWLPEYIQSCGIQDPWGKFFSDWLELLSGSHRVIQL